MLRVSGRSSAGEMHSQLHVNDYVIVTSITRPDRSNVQLTFANMRVSHKFLVIYLQEF